MDSFIRSREDGGMYTIPRLRVLLNGAATAADRRYIQYLIDGHPDTVGDVIWAEMLAARQENTDGR